MKDDNRYIELELMSCTHEFISGVYRWEPRSANWATNIPLEVGFDTALGLACNAFAALAKRTQRDVYDSCILSVTEDYGGNRYCFTTTDIYPPDTQTTFRIPL